MSRTSKKHRATKETDISFRLDLDSTKEAQIQTCVPFLTHMLDVFSKHGRFFIECDVKGDTDIDLHHTVEDTGIVLGQLFKEALGDKRGIARFGSMFLPMDDVLVRVVLDLSGRPYFKWNVKDPAGKSNEFDVEICKHFFRSFTDHLQLNLHIELFYGEDVHHIVEAIFKGVAYALSGAVQITGSQIPSTKGVL